MKKHSYVELLEHGVPVSKLTEVIIHEFSAFNLGTTVDFNFRSRRSVGGYCRSLGFSTNRNWSMLVLDKRGLNSICSDVCRSVSRMRRLWSDNSLKPSPRRAPVQFQTFPLP